MKRNFYWLLALVLVTGAGGFLYQRYGHRHGGKDAYREARVERGDISTTILATGTVQPENRLDIKPTIAGRVEQVLVEEGQMVKKGQMLAWISSTERAALIDAARAEGPAEVARWEKLYRASPVVAPIPGMIIARNVENGQTFSTTDAILTMSDRLTVKAQVDETDIAAIHLKQSAEIVLDAYPGNRLPAVVDQIAYDAKTVNNVTTYTIDVLPVKTPEFMRSGMTANVTFQSDAHKGVLIIPTDALKIDAGKSSVTLRDENGDTYQKPVQTGLNDGKHVEIVSGLTEQDIVLVPVFALKDKKNGANPFSPMGGGRPRGGGGR
jgi:macrolide-specific efflux system membrane fusion protein